MQSAIIVVWNLFAGVSSDFSAVLFQSDDFISKMQKEKQIQEDTYPCSHVSRVKGYIQHLEKMLIKDGLNSIGKWESFKTVIYTDSQKTT